MIECFCGCGLLDATEEAVTARWNQRIEPNSRDTARIDWLADVDNDVGQVLLPSACVTENVHSLRDAIDAAMSIGRTA